MNKIKTIIVLSFWLILVAFNVFSNDKEYSTSERRKLAQQPELTYDTVMNTKFMSDFETYALDQFYLRDGFRSIKSSYNLNLLQQLDYHDIYLSDGNAIKIENPLNENSLEHVIEKFNSIENLYLDDNNTFISIIPDKHYFNENSYYPTINYDDLVTSIIDNVSFNYIDIFDTLKLEDYYLSDPHWNQVNIQSVANQILSAFGKDSKNDYKTVIGLENYNGLYQGQIGLNLKDESLEYLTNDTIQNAIVTDLTTGNILPVYNTEKIEGMEPYDVFLSGATPLIEINNDKAITNDELIIFRDSYGSSLTPLLIDSYKKITLVDIRYIDHKVLDEYIAFDKQDVLFLYSTTVLNNGLTLR